MNKDDMGKAFDDILAQVDERLSATENKLEFDKGSLPKISEIEESVIKTNNVDNPERSERQTALLKELEEEPLVVSPRSSRNPMDVPDIKPVEVPDINPIEVSNIKPEASALQEEKKYTEEDLDRFRDKTVGEVVIPKREKTIEQSHEEFEKKCKNARRFLAAVMATVVVSSIAIPSKIHRNAVDSYVDNASSLSDFANRTDNPSSPYISLESIGSDVGYAIADELVVHGLSNQEQDYDINKALIKYLAATYDILVKSSDYTKKGAMGEQGHFGDVVGNSYNNHWMDKIYEEVAKVLQEKGVVNLPKSLKEYLEANGFYKSKLRYDKFENKLYATEDNDINDKTALDNLSAYGNSLIGRKKNPENEISSEFNVILSTIKKYYPDYKISYDQEGIHIKDEHGNEVNVLKTVNEGDYIVSFPETDVGPKR